MSFAGAAVWLIGDFLLVERHLSYAAVPYWNAIMQEGVFVIIVLLLSRLKVALLHEKQSSRLKSNMLCQIEELNLAVTSNFDLESVGKSLLDTIELFFPGWATTLMLINEQTGALEHFASRNLEKSTCMTALLHWFGTREVINTKAPFVVQNHHVDRQEDQFFVRMGWVSHVGLPLLTRGEALGVLSIFTDKEHNFTDEEVTFFTTLAGQAVIALQNARLFTEVRNGHQQLKELSHRLLEVQETDRRHIARELHDEVGQILTGLQINLDMTGHSSDQKANITLAKAQSLVNDLIRHVRRLSLDLRPSLLDDLGLLPTFLWYLERYTSTTGVQVNFHHDGLEGKRFLPQVETAAYRIVQEALTNVARHAQVDHVLVNICCIPDSLILKIQDTGAGFDPGTAIRAGKANGLTGMRERASLLGGELSIESMSGTGTCIIAELPLYEISDNIPTNERDNDRPGR